jgi:hypothetical protein
MVTVQVVLESETIDGSTMLIPFEVTWLGEHTCRHLREHVLDIHFKRPEVLATLEHVASMCVRGTARGSYDRHEMSQEYEKVF